MERVWGFRLQKHLLGVACLPFDLAYNQTCIAPSMPSPFESAIHAEHCPAVQLPHFDSSKAREELGLDFIDVRQSAQDMAASLLELGVVKARPGAPVSQFYSKL